MISTTIITIKPITDALSYFQLNGRAKYTSVIMNVKSINRVSVVITLRNVMMVSPFGRYEMYGGHLSIGQVQSI